MTIRPTLLTLLLALTPFIAFAQTLEQDLRAAEEQLAAGLIDKDPATFARLLAPGFIMRGTPDVSRDAWMANALAMCWGKGFQISDFAIVDQSSDRAVVALLLTTEQDPVTCEPAIVRSLITDVWIREGGNWRLALRHSAPPAESIAGQFAKVAPPPPRWEGSAEFSLVATGGNTDTQTLGAGTSVTWRPGAWTTTGRGAFVRSATADIVTAESSVIEIRTARALSPRAELFARGEYLVDRFSGIDSRSSVDAGFGWLVVDEAPHKLKVDVGLGATREARLAGDDVSFASATTSAIYTWQIAPTTTLTEQPLFTMALAEAGNWRFQNSLSVAVSMTRRLSIRLGHELRHLNRPVPGFQERDTILSAALVARF